MADVFDEHGPEEERTRLWRLINETPWLDWLMLTKRPQNIVDMLPFIEIGGEKLPRFDNVWLGTTVESQAAADERIPILLATPAAVRFLSVEPQLEEVRILCPHCGGNGNDHRAGDGGGCSGSFPDWVIVGGESGSKARPFHVEWARSIRDQCRAAGVTFFMKQMGAYPVVALGSEETWPNSTLFEFDDDGKGEASRACLKDCAGADPSEWPEDFRVRQFPKGRS
jgi:protein gp37